MKLLLMRIYWLTMSVCCRFIKVNSFINYTATIKYTYTRRYLSSKGVSLGKNSIVYNTTFSSSSKGDKFYIGDNCTITGCTLLGHDASPTLFIPELVNSPEPWLIGARRSYRKPIKIGNNCFIGYGSIILPGVIIGNNVVIAAGSVVTSNIPDNSVYGGNPAKLIKPIDVFIGKYQRLLTVEPEAF